MTGADRASARSPLPADVDVLVAGSGAAGLVAALAAAQHGARVLVVERGDAFGGTTALSGGRVWAPGNAHAAVAGRADSAVAAGTYLRAVCPSAPDGHVEAFVATCDPNPGPSPPVELDVWAGRYWNLSEKFSADLRLSQYTYPDDPRRITYNRTEITGTLGYRNQLFVAAIYSPNTSAVASSPGYHEGNAWALEVSGRYPFNERFALSAGLGNYDLQDVYKDSYQYWNVTFTATLKPFELQLAYLGVSDNAEEHFNEDSVGDRVAFTALWRFSSTH